MDIEQLPPSFYELFDASLPRLGPGDDASTRRALETLLPLSPTAVGTMRILDIGCGNGAPTIQLGKHTTGTITAVDNHEPYLAELRRRARSEGLSGRIQTCLRDMRTLGSDMGTFDLVWSESALFVMGFREGLSACHDMLLPGGLFAASEMCWIHPEPPLECQSYFAEVYPAIAGPDYHLAAIANCGYEEVGHFLLPESSWWDTYYTPLEARLGVLRRKYAGDVGRTALYDAVQEEIEIYRAYSRYYGYMFYMMRRI